MNDNKIITINATQLKNIVCECGNDTFHEAYQLKTVPALLSPTQKKEMLKVPVFSCTECKKILIDKPDGNKKMLSNSGN